MPTQRNRARRHYPKQIQRSIRDLKASPHFKDSVFCRVPRNRLISLFQKSANFVCCVVNPYFVLYGRIFCRGCLKTKLADIRSKTQRRLSSLSEPKVPLFGLAHPDIEKYLTPDVPSPELKVILSFNREFFRRITEYSRIRLTIRNQVLDIIYMRQQVQDLSRQLSQTRSQTCNLCGGSGSILSEHDSHPCPRCQPPLRPAVTALIDVSKEDTSHLVSRCVACMDAKPTIMFSGCRHLSMCETCSVNITKCPFCYSESKKERIFLP